MNPKININYQRAELLEDEIDSIKHELEILNFLLERRQKELDELKNSVNPDSSDELLLA